MKALSIKQPWASLIAHGIKDIENRTWRTNYRGRIYIHVSAPKKFNVQMTDEQTIAATPVMKTAFEGTMPFGAIIGEVDIVDCVINHPSIWAEKMETDVCPDTRISILRRGQKYIWNWVLANPVLYDEPIINVKGKLSLWEFRKDDINPPAGEEAFHPGVFLQEEIEARGLLKKDVAQQLDLSPANLSEIFSGKRNISPKLAVNLEKAFGISAEYWLNLQMGWDLKKARKEGNNV
ncbi:MAG TPA: HigA family addiction module antitoxin [Sphingobacterium sp.]|nr:HigA family addiction module antitoxin [Sphingobacterium sp.]